MWALLVKMMTTRDPNSLRSSIDVDISGHGGWRAEQRRLLGDGGRLSSDDSRKQRHVERLYAHGGGGDGGGDREPPREKLTTWIITCLALSVVFSVAAFVFRKKSASRWTDCATRVSRKRSLRAPARGPADAEYSPHAAPRHAVYNAYGEKYFFFRQVTTNAMYDIWASLVILGRWLCQPGFTATTGGTRLTCCKSDKTSFPVWKFAVLALLDGLADFLQSSSGSTTPGSWQVLINQAQIFFIMACSWLLLRSRYKWVQVFGATLTLVGTCIGVIPNLGRCDSDRCLVTSTIVFFAADVPAALSTVWKQAALQGAGIDVFVLTAAVSWLQLFLTWALLPLQSFSAFGGVDLHSLPDAVADGARCFAGDTSVAVYDKAGKVIGHCGPYVTMVTFAFSLSGFISGILNLYVVKHGSAALMVLGTAVTVPLSALAFSVPAIMGKDAQPFNWDDVVGLALVALGFLAYNYKEVSGLCARKESKQVQRYGSDGYGHA